MIRTRIIQCDLRGFTSVIRKIMKGALEKVCLWATRCKPGINLMKTKLMQFSTKTKVPKSPSPLINGQGLSLSSKVKYPHLIAASKLDWRLNVEGRTI